MPLLEAASLLDEGLAFGIAALYCFLRREFAMQKCLTLREEMPQARPRHGSPNAATNDAIGFVLL
jgi:hypothetical protein